MTAGPATTTHLLVVCEADRARSPVFARLLRREAELRGLGAVVRVYDAGLRARPGEPILPSVARAVRPFGLGLETHRSTPLELPLQDPAELLLTMTEEQRRTLVLTQRELLPRTFTVREAVRLLSSRWWDPQWDGTPHVVVQLHRLRPLVRPARTPEDVPDPAHGGRRLAGAVVDELNRASARLAGALWGPAPAPGQTSTVGR